MREVETENHMAKLVWSLEILEIQLMKIGIGLSEIAVGIPWEVQVRINSAKACQEIEEESFHDIF